MKANSKKKKYLLLIANIYPLLAVLFLDWSIFELLFVYFSETVLFFIISLVKIYFLEINLSAKIKYSVLYFFVFSIFLLFAGAVSLLYFFAEIEKTYPDASIYQIINLIFNSSYFVSLLLFVGVDIYYFVVNFVKKKEYLKHTAQTLIREPALHIWILLMSIFTAIGILNYYEASPLWLLAVFILLKTWINLVLFQQKESNFDARELYK